MSTKNKTKKYRAVHCKTMVCQTNDLDLIGEEPFLLRVEDKSYSVVMRTPGDELAHAAGFCLGEGIIDSPDDIKTLGYDADLDPNVVDVWLTPERKKKVGHILARRTYVSQTSCGICGKEMIKDLTQVLQPIESDVKVEISKVFHCIAALSKNQKYYQRTRGSHASIIFDKDLNMLSFAEDVGRHNGLDKAIGKAFLEKSLHRAGLLVLSSRISYELVQKSARAGLGIMISNSRPTALAVDMGKSLNMTMAFPAGENELMVVCGAHRILGT